MVGSRNEPEQLLELLQAAAGELKTAQSALEAERAKNRQLLAQVDRLETQLKASPALVTEQRAGLVITVPSGMRASGDEKTGVVSLDGDLAETRLRGLEEELERAKNAEQAVRGKLADVEADYAEAMASLSKLRNGVSTAEESSRVVKLAQQLNAMSKELSAARAELASRETTGTLTVAPDVLAPPSPQPPAAPSPNAEAAAESAKRLSQLEGELALLRARRDDLNVELARVENDRKMARTRIAELEVEASKAREHFEAEQKKAVAAEVSKREAMQQAHGHVLVAESAKREALVQAHGQEMSAETAKRTEAESARDKEREKHQATAQKLVDARTRMRELEAAVAQLTARIGELEAQLGRVGEVAEQALAANKEAWASAQTGLEARATAAEQRLDEATNELRHVERTYEQLHKEMLTLLDQRDEARRELNLVKTRLGITP